MMTTGEILKKKRIERGCTVSDAANAIRTKTRIVQAIEDDNFDVFSAPVYARGFLKLYAEYLDMDATALIDTYEAEHVGKVDRSATVAEATQVRRRLAGQSAAAQAKSDAKAQAAAEAKEQAVAPAPQTAATHRKPIFSLLAGKTLDESDPAHNATPLPAQPRASETRQEKDTEPDSAEELDRADATHPVAGQPSVRHASTRSAPDSQRVSRFERPRGLPRSEASIPESLDEAAGIKERVAALAGRGYQAVTEDRRVLLAAIGIAIAILIAVSLALSGDGDKRLAPQPVPRVASADFETVIPPPEPYVD